MTSARMKMTTAIAPPPPADETPWYELIYDTPEPLEDGIVQDRLLSELQQKLMARYEKDASVLVAGPLTFVIYDSETPGSIVAPDCFIVFGVDAQMLDAERHSYRIDEWDQAPAFVLEMASPSTAARDLTEKRDIYSRMGAQEYWRLDRTGENYGQPLVGERLVDGEYVRYELHTEPNGDIWSHSEVLGIDFYYRIEEGLGTFLLRDSATGDWLNKLGDEIVMRRAAQAEAREAQAEAREARDHNRRLEAELERLRRQLRQQ